MLPQNRLRIMKMKYDFSIGSKKYSDALKYNGYLNKNTINSQFNPIAIIKNSRTLTKQASIPKLPVPLLETSIIKYLAAAKPFLNENEFENTKKIAAEFSKKDGIGEKLQKLLIQKSKVTDNWLSQWWLDKIYLEPRYNVIINVNPATLYPLYNYDTLEDQLIFATKYICGFLEYKQILEEQKLAPEKMGNSYLCMDQYYKLIGTCRIPNKNKDLIKINHIDKIILEKINHITVINNNRIFSLEIIDKKSGLSLSSSEIYYNLKNLVKISQEVNHHGLGILTAENRDTWSDIYNNLCLNDQNKKNFESIHNSLFVLCLDTQENKQDKGIDLRSSASGQILHGNKLFTSNRWFDKTIQIIIGSNGVWGTNFEHSIAEAIPHAMMNDFIYNYILRSNFDINDNVCSKCDLVKELIFEIPESVKSQIEKSKASIFKIIDNLDLYILDFDVFGKKFPKSQKISPDAFVQIAMQLAFYRAHNKVGNAYESGSLRKFHFGRTEIIRSCTSDAIVFIKSMTNSTLSNIEKSKLFLKAINSHRLYTISVLECESFDRHMLGLKLIALENDIELPEIYNDISFKKLCHYFISSSQVSSKFDAVTSYGPAVEDGYGACYNITENKIIFGISSYKSHPSTSSKYFADNIASALLDCQSLLLKFNSKL